MFNFVYFDFCRDSINGNLLSTTSSIIDKDTTQDKYVFKRNLRSSYSNKFS